MFTLINMKKNPKKSILFTANIEVKNHDRILVVAKEMKEDGEATFINRTSAADKLIELGYHVYRHGRPATDIDGKVPEQVADFVKDSENMKKNIEPNSSEQQ